MLFKEFGKIKPDKWQRFCEQKSTPVALALSGLNSELAKKNIHPHRLVSAGYGPKVEKWRAEAEAAREAGVPYKYEGLEEHTLNWDRAREVKDKESGQQVIPDAHTEVAAEAIKALA
jgi:hypothetical protein